MQNIVTLGEINDALKIAAVSAAQLADMGFAALANKPICEGLPPEESRRLRNAKLYPAESIGQIRVALAQRLAAPATMQASVSNATCQAAPAAVAVPDAWQPISAAPKSGQTLMLGFFNETGKWRTTRGQWFTQENIDDTWEDADDCQAGWYETPVVGEDCYPITPTHWMPLPAAPGSTPSTAAPATPAASATTLTPRAHFIKGWDAALMYLGMQGSVDSDRAMRQYMAAIPSRYAEATAVAAPDERAAFEAWAKSEDMSIGSDCDGYIHANTAAASQAWQARAALAATPAAAPDTLRNIAIEELAQLGYTFDGDKMMPPDFVGELMHVVQTAQCGCREGTCETKSDRACRMKTEIAAAAPVVLPEPDFWVRPGATIHPDRGWQCWSNDGTATGAFHADTVRALLAGVSAPAAVALPVAHPACKPDMLVNGGALKMALNVLRRAGKNDVADELEATAAPQAQADARDAEQEVLMEHSGCGSNTQVDMLTVRLNPGDKVVMHKGRITQGFDRATGAKPYVLTADDFTKEQLEEIALQEEADQRAAQAAQGSEHGAQ